MIDFIIVSTPIFRSIVRFRTINVTKVLQNLNIGGKVLFSGVFDTSSILQYRGMVMDENGRNGRKWHLAQQITYHVIMRILSITTNHTTSNVITHTPCNSIITQIWVGGIFISLINIKNFPPYAIIIIYNLLTNRWLEYGIIRWY